MLYFHNISSIYDIVMSDGDDCVTW